jgi:hypothetical protein
MKVKQLISEYCVKIFLEALEKITRVLRIAGLRAVI